MKKTHIILIVFIAVLMGALFGTVMDSSEFAGFEEAFQNPEKEFRVSGFLDLTEEIIYEATVDPGITKFMMTDKKGKTNKVILQKSKPTGLENSESIVLIGKAQGDVFVAKDMQMKCPSKYNQEKHLIEQVSQ